MQVPEKKIECPEAVIFDNPRRFARARINSGDSHCPPLLSRRSAYWRVSAEGNA